MSSRPLLIGFIAVFVLNTSGCQVLGAISGAVLAEPEMTSDLDPLDSGADATFKYRDGRKTRETLLGVDELSPAEYSTYYQTRVGQSSDSSALPILGDSLFVSTIQAPDSLGAYIFHGFAGYGNVRLRLTAEDGILNEIPTYDVIQSIDVLGNTMSNWKYLNFARDGLLPSSTIFIVEARDGKERVHADDVIEIKSRIRHNRVVKGFWIGMVIDTAVAVAMVIWLRHECGGECNWAFD